MTNTIITVGIPASGKTTWAKKIAKEYDEYVIVSRDDIRRAHGWESGEAEQRVTEIHRAQMEAAYLAGKDVIVADTNINPKFRKALVKFCHEHGSDVEIATFPISLAEAMDRNSKRTFDRVPDKVVINFYEQYRDQNPQNEVLPAPKSTPYRHAGRHKAVVFDIDGTLAKNVSRNPYDETRVYEDEVHEDVALFARLVAEQDDINLIIVSGRKSTCEEDTIDWLNDKAGIEPFSYSLYMRKAADNRPDYVVKNEIYDKYIIPIYDVVMAYDDRDQVVRHVRARGITVAQVAPGRF